MIYIYIQYIYIYNLLLPFFVSDIKICECKTWSKVPTDLLGHVAQEIFLNIQ